MSLEIYDAFIGFAAAVLVLIGGMSTVPLINRIKNFLGWSGRKVQLLTLAMSVVVAFVGLVATGAVSPEPVTTARLVELLTLVLLASQAEYSRIKNQK